MKRLLALTLFALLAISYSCRYNHTPNHSRSMSMSYSVRTQAELDAANQRMSEFKRQLLQQGFREVAALPSDEQVSVPVPHSKEQLVLQGQYGTVKDLRVTLWTIKHLEETQTDLAGGVSAAFSDEQANRDFEELYKKVAFAVTGQPQ